MLYVVLMWVWWPFWGAKAWLRRRKMPTSSRKVLLVQTAKIGDMVCTSPLIESILAAGDRVTVCHAPLNTPLLRHDERIQREVMESSAWRGWRGKWRIIQWLRRENFDAVVLVSINVPWVVMTAFAAIPLRIAVTPDAPSRTMRWGVRGLTHRLEHYVDRLILEEWRILFAQLSDMRWEVRPAEKLLHLAPRAVCDAQWQASGLLGMVVDGAIGLGVGASNTLKALGVERLVTLINALHERNAACVIVLIGAENDRQDAAAIVRAVRVPHRVLDATGAFSLDVLPTLLRRFALYVGVDSGMTYLADAWGVPVVSIVGPTNPAEQRPLGMGARFIVERPTCYPCAFVHHTPHRCRTQTLACIRQVSLSDVVTQVIEMFDAK